MVHFYRDRGYSGFILADHFAGNTTFPDDMPWKERVNRFYAIYEEALDEIEKIGGGIKVFFGMEYALRSRPTQLRYVLGNDFVILGLTKEWLLENEEAFGMNPNETFDAVHAAGGFIIHAHPFAEAPWIRSIQLLPRKIDAVEVYNACTPDFHNENAQWYADRYGLPCTGGSDIHHATQKALAALETETPCETVADLCAAIRERKTKILRLNADELLANPLNAR
jgi:predicted metal-dependent phosphoesterase TrpH